MYTFNGIGTRLYGKRDQATDGSYIATKWFTLFYFPVVPLSSYRVQAGEEEWRFLGSSRQYYMVKIKLSWRQVLNCYLASLFIGPLMAYVLIGGLYYTLR